MFRERPRNVRDIDFAILERKLDIIDKNQKMKALDIQTSLKGMMGDDILGATGGNRDTAIVWKREKEKLVAIIKRKNREISGFRYELDNLLLQLSELKGR